MIGSCDLKMWSAPGWDYIQRRTEWTMAKYGKREAERDAIEQSGNRHAEEHPEDRKVREDGENYAREKGAAFCEKHRAQLNTLITIYADSRAESMLDALREQFWTRDWEKKR